MRAPLLALLLLTGALVQAAPDEPKHGPAPKLVIKDKELDFGEVIHGHKRHLEVPLHNAGEAALEIKDVKPSCGCTVASYPRRIEPGKSATLALEFDSSERPAGYQSFRIAIYSNDPSQRDQGAYCTVLNLRGEVRTMFRLLPMGAFFGEFIHGLKAATKTVRVVGIDQAKGGFTLELASTLPDYLKVEIKPWTGPNGQRGQEVHVTLDPSVPVGQVNTSLELRTSVKVQPKLRVMVAALVNTRIMGPQSVDFGAIDRATGAERVAMVARRDDQDGLPLVKVVSPYPWLQARTSLRDPRPQNLELEVAPGAPPGSFAGEVHLLFDDPDQPVLSVPVTGRIRSRVGATPSVLLLPAKAEQGARLGLVRTAAPVSAASVEPATAGLSARVTKDGVELVLSGPALPTAPARLVLTTAVEGEERVELPILPR